ncbi:MAG TPA: hypothetical protein VFK06_10885 [Candidatus Angelobacter sp.]|nr:hypothetical protein [Candidatus Angelobacter sp.]
MSRFSQAVITAFLLVTVCSAQNWTTVSAANITDLNQNKLATGQLCFLGTDQNDNPISFNVGGGGQVLKRAFCAQVAAGAVTAFTVPNPVNTTPAGVFYRVTVKDSSTGQEVLRYTQVTFSGGAFNFDAYAPVSIGSFTPPTGTATPGNLTVNGNLNVTGSFIGSVLGLSNLSGTIGANQNATALNAQTGSSYTMLDSDRGKLVTLNNASAVSVALPQAGAGSQFAAGWYTRVENLGAGVVTITPATSTLDGAASLTLRQFGGVVIVSDGANYFTVRGRVVSAADLSNGTTGTSGSPVVLATSPALTTPNIGAATGASLDLSGGNIQSSALVSTRNNVGNNQVEFGHPNPAGYGSNLGYESSSGQPFFCFACQAGSTTNTYRTRGIVGRIIKYDIGASSLDFGRIANLNADNQSVTIDMLIDSSGNLKIQGAQYVQPGSTPFSGLPSAPNGSIIYCSDCNSTCTAGSSTGRTCFRENGTWTH